LLESIADLLEIKGEQSYRVRAYREAAHQVQGLGVDIAALHKAGQLQTVRGIGPSIAAKVGEYLDTGRSAYLEELSTTLPPGLLDLLQVPGLGLERARAIYDRLGLRTIGEVIEAGRTGALRAVPGIGPKTEKRLVDDLERHVQSPKRILLSVALPAGAEAVETLSAYPDVQHVTIVGSLRRMCETVGNIDLLAASMNAERVVDRFVASPLVRDVLSRDGNSCEVLSRDKLRLSLRVVPPRAFGAALQHYTGSREHNRALQSLARERGYTLSPDGLRRRGDGTTLSGLSEEEVYATLGLEYPPPELRENRGEIEAAAEFRLPALLTEADLRGDLHVHTTYSDGSASLEAMAVGAVERGYEYMAVTDHSLSLRVAGGLSIERVREQRRAIDEINRRLHPFRVLAGTEVEIRGSGVLDYPDEVLREFDLVTASLHSARGQSGERATQRVVQALHHPLVDILNHPSGRIIGRRDAYAVDLDVVIGEALTTGTALELNASPDRLDLSDVWVRKAKDSGVLIAVSTDAHSVGQLSFMRYGVSQARRAWLTPGEVLNALPLDALVEWLARVRPAA
jgi:DNA polymerase (family 10)